MLKGIDISHYQNGINVKDLGVDFVICKATEGVGYTDNCCDKFYQQAKASGKKVGIYHFARPDLGNSAEAEADYFVSQVQGYIKDGILILDWEPSGGQISNVAWAKAWLDRVYSKTGVRPIIYMSQSPVNSYDWSSVVNGDYGLWVAKYGTNNGNPGEAPSVKWWKFYIMWQYSSKGRISGYDGNLDVNEFYGDKTAWDKYANPSGTQDGSQSAPQPKPVEKSVDELAREVINGVYGNGDERKQKLGSRYDEVQAKVNEILGASKPNYVTYTVKRGDTLSSIASKYGTTYQKIARDNGIVNPNVIYPGQVIRIYK